MFEQMAVALTALPIFLLNTESDKSDVYAGERKNRERTWAPMTTKAF